MTLSELAERLTSWLRSGSGATRTDTTTVAPARELGIDADGPPQVAAPPGDATREARGEPPPA